jgi:uncharacterized protein
MNTSQNPVQPASRSKKLQQAMREHPLFFFFLIAFVFSWLVSIPFILSEWGILQGDFTFAFVLKSFGPFLAAYIMTRLLEGKEGLGRLKGSIRQVHAGWQWYIFSLLGLPALFILGVILIPGAMANFQGLTLRLFLTYPLYFFGVFFGGGPLGEEPGWRGFALPRMQTRYGPLLGSLLLGLIWGMWHLPDFLTSSQGGGPGTGLTNFLKNLPIFLLFIIALSIILTWIFNHTHGSLFFALLAHTSINVPQVVLVPLFLGLAMTSLNLALLISFGLPALLIVILTRSRLGYQSSQQ